MYEITLLSTTFLKSSAYGAAWVAKIMDEAVDIQNDSRTWLVKLPGKCSMYQGVLFPVLKAFTS
jgi:hypothetical protein